MRKPKLKLRPCPFCGNTVLGRKGIPASTPQTSVAVWCPLCGGQGPASKDIEAARKGWGFLGL